jgi:hypothetical protein
MNINENLQYGMLLEKPLTNMIPTLPPQLLYNNEKISSITPYIKEIKYSPNTGLHYENGQTIKFLLNSTGFIDPYATYLSFEIENTTEYPLQFDNSAHSLISSLIISINGNVIEEITDYDVIQSIVFDSTYNNNVRRDNKNCCFGYCDKGEVFYGTCENILFNKTSVVGGGGNSILNSIVNNLWTELKYDDDCNTSSVVNGMINRFLPKSKIKICLPLMSNIFGFGLSFQNYKWLPLELFPNLEFAITLNNHALFKPILSKKSYGEGGGIVAETIINSLSGEKRNYKLGNLQLLTTQLFFDSSILTHIRDIGLRNGLVIETQLIQSFQQKNFTKSPENTYVLNVPRKSVRSVMTIFLNRIYEKNAICRKLKRYSRGLIKFQVRIGEEHYPYLPIEGDSSTSDGIQNNLDFFRNWQKVFYKTNVNYSDSIINQQNYGIDGYFVDYLVKKRNVDGFSNNETIDDLPNFKTQGVQSNGNIENKNNSFITTYTNDVVGRCIYAISLDQIPLSGNIYKSGVDTRFVRPILIETVQKNNFEHIYESTEQYVQYVMLEFDYTLKIGTNGFLEKIF